MSLAWCKELGFEPVIVESVSSTNDALIERMKDDAADRTLLLAASQESGKGRRGNSWQSLPGNLHMSWSERPNFDAQSASQIVYLVGLAVVDALFECGLDAQLKWPNDVMVDDKKIAGVLVESGMKGDSLDYVVIGLGLNVAASPTGDGINATSLKEQHRKVEMPELMEHIMTAYTRYYDCWQEEGFDLIRTEWEEMAYKLGETATARTNDGQIEGTLDGLDGVGNLQFTTTDGDTLSLNAAEVSFS